MNPQRSPDLTFSGLGLHSGTHCSAVIRRAPRGQGISFSRSDLTEARPIPASHLFVRSSDRRTVLGHERSDISIATTEHFLAALTGVGYWDAFIDVAGPELPILDGSARPIVRALKAWSAPERAAPLVIDEPIQLRRGSSQVTARPSERFSITCIVEFDHRHVSRQEFSWDGSEERFRAELAPARTFGFLDEVDDLRQRGLAGGGSLDNALVFGPEGPLNAPRFPDEPVRHKVVDALGDLALLGRPIQAELHLVRPGHKVMAELIRRISEVEV